MTQPAPDKKQDTLIGRLVVEQGLATREEVQACVARQAELAKEQNYRSVADLLVEDGHITKRQVERIRTLADEQKDQQIPGYMLLSRLGAGAMATVYKANQMSLNRLVAIKVLPQKSSTNTEFVERFYKEGRAAAQLNHPNIVGAIDVGEAPNGRHFFVMEYIDGETVHDRLENGQRYTEKEAIQIITQVAKALEHAHKAGFIHRDVKPKNIMITSEGVAKLADMGLAREASDAQAAQAEAGKAYGTPYYISPEQIRGEMDVDQRADLYSLGATFYHMVTGRVPFEADTPSAVMHKHLREALVPPDHLVPDLSSGVGEIIEVAMAKRRKDRYSSAEEMLTDLARVAAGEPPLVAKQAYDLSTLSDLEKKNGPVPLSAQRTIDIGAASLSQRLMDPIVLALAGALLLALIVILLLLMRG
ncbi:MAG: serine/threonine protein kinase [Phycisphaerales bacterium]|nr:serine/threonine protein kinase [Phycisphaerales bacterium]